MKTINQKLLKKFLDLAGKRLSGQWVLMGGTLLPLLGIEHRITTDIDLAGLSQTEQAQTLKLMEIAEELGLPVESINQAGAYFLHKVKSFEKHLVLLHQGINATIYRPNGTLFLRLKIKRLSETDLQDCLEFIKAIQDTEEPLNEKTLLTELRSELKKSKSNERTQRLEALSKAVKDFSKPGR